jgi:hypothetical protein
MNEVGTNIGTAYVGHQGVGKATILQGEDASNVGMAFLKQQQADAEAKRKQALGDRDALLKELQTSPDGYWVKHSKDIGDAQSALLDKYASLLAKGVNDPKASTNPDAIAFQRDYLRLRRMINASKQMKAAADDMQTAIQKDKDGPDAFTTDSIMQYQKFLTTPLSDIVDGNAQVPILERRRPYVDSVTFWQPYIKAYEASLNGAPVTDAGIEDYVHTVLTSPATSDKLASTYASRLQQMPQQERAGVQQRAILGRRSEIEQIAFEDAKRVVKQAEPFNPYQSLIEAAKKVEVDYSESRGPGGGSRRPDIADLDKNLSVTADALIESRPEWLTLYDAQGKVEPIKPGESEKEYRARVKKEMVASMKSLVKLQSESFSTDQGKQKQSADNWLADIKSDNIYTQQRASGYLIGAQLFGNLDISDVQIVSTPQDTGGGTLKIVLTTPLGVQVKTEDIVAQARNQVSPQAQVIEKQGVREMLIPLDKTAPTNEMLLRIHDIAFQRTKQEYKKQDLVGTLDQYIGKRAPGSTTIEDNKKVKPY